MTDVQGRHKQRLPELQAGVWLPLPEPLQVSRSSDSGSGCGFHCTAEKAKRRPQTLQACCLHSMSFWSPHGACTACHGRAHPSGIY